nr:alanine racemase [Leucobacter sp.]
MRFAEISLPAIRHNIVALKQHTGAGVIVVVKADAYGHGAGIVAPAVIEAGAEMVAVASLEEAAALREGGFRAPILCWLHAEHLDYAAVSRCDVQLGVSRVSQLERLAAAARSTGSLLSAQLKLDTGLSRNGAAPDTWEALFTAAAAAERAGLVRITGVFSHLANAGDAANCAQARTFEAGVRRLRAHGVAAPLRHLAASAAAISSPHLAYDAVRVGLAAFGLSPEQDGAAAALDLRPVMTFATEITSLRWVAGGTGVSDGFTHT